MFCENVLEFYPIGQPLLPDSVGVIKLLIGFLYMTMVGTTIFWIHHQERMARKGDDGAVKSVIFPVFTKMMWMSAFSSFYIGVLLIFVPVNVTRSNDGIEALLYPLAWSFQHAVIEGIPFLLMQKGCGKNAAKRAGLQTLLWCLLTFLMQVVVYYYGGMISIVAQGAWSVIILVFYFALWKLPRHRLFRRPAAILYAQFWFWFRVMVLIVFTCALSGNILLRQIGECGYVFGPLLLFALLQPGMSYWCLLQDSRWWQGLAISQGSHRLSSDTLLSPLLGADISLQSAQTLAHTMDALGREGSRLLNFANIYLDKTSILGHGSFSKVYRGMYQDTPCAIKLIFTLDLTEDVIQRVAAEASILSAAHDPNVVKIYGVSVLPPSVCIVLELCAYGSLSYVLRGDMGDVFDSNNKASVGAMRLSMRDRIFLALGCARGLAAVHRLGGGISHRDVKSFNFLVDSNLNAKLADLEMGGQGESDKSVLLGTDDILVNWVAPEVLRGCEHTQASDTYSLSLVLWEIISGKIPFVAESDDNNSETVKRLITAGYRPPLPNCPKAYRELVTKSWSDDPLERYSAQEMASVICSLWYSMTINEIEDIDASVGIMIGVSNFLRSRDGIKFAKAICAFEPPQTMVNTPSNASFVSGNITVSDTASDKDVFKSSDDRKKVDRHMIFCAGEGVDKSTGHELTTLYSSITNDISWQLGDTMNEPMLIISPEAPHIIVKSSAEWNVMMGYSAVQMFGHTMDHYVLNSPEVSDQYSMRDFYESMRSFRCAHVLATLIDSSGESILCSLHSYAVTRKDRVSVNISVDTTESSTPIARLDSLDYSTSTSTDFQRQDTTSSADTGYEPPFWGKVTSGGFFFNRQTSQQAKRPDFFVIYISPLESQYCTSNTSKLQDGRFSTDAIVKEHLTSTCGETKRESMTPELRKLGLATNV